MTTNRRDRGGGLTCTMRVILTTKAIRKKKGDKEEVGNNDKTSVTSGFMSTLNVSNSHTRLPPPPPKKAPDFRHPDEVLNRTQQHK